MDLQKEREAFEKHASKFFTDSKEAFKTNGDQYLYDEVIWMWDCWIERAKAQAVPDGYKVVPVNYECVWCGCTELDGWTDETMIESQEQAND